MLRFAGRRLSRLLHNQKPAVRITLTNSEVSVVEFDSTCALPCDRAEVRWGRTSIRNTSSVAALRDDQSQHGSGGPSSIESSHALQCDRSNDSHPLQMCSKDSDVDSLIRSPSDHSVTAKEIAPCEKEKSFPRIAKWTRLPPAPPLFEFRGAQERPFSASKWIKKCRPDLTHGLTSKLFRKRQVRGPSPRPSRLFYFNI